MMGKIKTYYKTNLLNIEEILSILEFQERFGNNDEQRSFIDYIKAVIEFYTPKIDAIDLSRSEDWRDVILGTRDDWQLYAYFVAALLQYAFSTNNYPSYYSLDFSPEQYGDNVQYSVISLNYDLVLENMAKFIGDRLMGNKRYFVRGREYTPESVGTPLAKLHGSVDTDDIVPPTWNKTLNHQYIAQEWKLAFKVLAEANHIRILGYSLPLTDTYIKYLLRAAIISAPHPKKIDILCLDQNGKIRERYDDFIDFENYRFMSGDIMDYLAHYMASASDNETNGVMKFSGLERAHSDFFNTL